jgi:hypothetical protein
LTRIPQDLEFLKGATRAKQWRFGAVGLTLAAFFAVFLSAACGFGSSRKHDVQSPSPSPTPLTAPAVPRTGLGIVDEVIGILNTGDAVAIARVIEFSTRVCSETPTVGGLRCPPGVPDGALLDVFESGNCSSSWTLATSSPADLASGLASFLHPPTSFETIAVAEQTPPDAERPSLKYWIVARDRNNLSRSLLVGLSPSGILLLSKACGTPPEVLKSQFPTLVPFLSAK